MCIRPRPRGAAPHTPEPAPDAPGPAAAVPAPVAPRPDGAAAARALPGPEPAPPAPEPAPPAPAGDSDLDLDRLRELWPAALDAVRAQNAMVGALLGEARPTALERGRLTVTFAPDTTFSKKKAESNRALLQGALQSLTGRSLEIAYELGDHEPDEPSGPRRLSEEELLERLVRDFGAKEVFEELDADPTPKD
ncbi:MAG: hypothetical protein IRZ21_07470, partial [Thermoleophilaceae bacterium]|nr:hypothetical protein [Thermoleophilaceae bacterium]